MLPRAWDVPGSSAGRAEVLFRRTEIRKQADVWGGVGLGEGGPAVTGLWARNGDSEG